MICNNKIRYGDIIENQVSNETVTNVYHSLQIDAGSLIKKLHKVVPIVMCLGCSYYFIL